MSDKIVVAVNQDEFETLAEAEQLEAIKKAESRLEDLRPKCWEESCTLCDHKIEEGEEFEWLTSGSMNASCLCDSCQGLSREQIMGKVAKRMDEMLRRASKLRAMGRRLFDRGWNYHTVEDDLDDHPF